MYALSPDEARRWVRLADIALSSRVERRLLDHEVLVLVHRTWSPHFGVDARPADLLPDDDEPVTLLEEPKAWVEIQLLTAGGAPAANVRYALVLQDGQVLAGRTNAAGLIRHDSLPSEGECVVRFPEVDED